MIPNGWHIRELQELAVVERGKFTARPRNDPKYYGGHIPFVQTGDVARSGGYLSAYSQTLNDAGVAISRVFRRGTILITIAANIGEVAILEIDAACPDSVVAVQPSPDVDTVWLAQAILAAKGTLDGYANQNAQKNINLEDLRPLSILTPPSSEQKELARLFSTWDRGILQLRDLIAAKLRFKQGLMQQLLTGKRRFPEFGSPAVSAQGIPSGWTQPKASDLFQSSSRKRNGEKHVLLSVTQDRGVIPRSTLEGRVVMPENGTEGYKLVEPGDFVISLRSFQGGLEYSKHLGLVSPAYTVLKPRHPINPAFYRHYFKSFEFIQRLAIAVIGIRDGKQISFADFESVRLPYPPLAEQKIIAETLCVVDREIELLQKQLDALMTQKKGLMQKLLTGQVRVKLANGGE